MRGIVSAFCAGVLCLAFAGPERAESRVISLHKKVIINADPSVIEELIKDDAYPNTCDKYNFTPLLSDGVGEGAGEDVAG